MPQLIAMVLVVVGALVYMFQTFGGTGNNIEGMAQKTSVITEINNIKSGLAVGLRSRDISVKLDGQGAADNENNDTTELRDLAEKEYFTTQINEQLKGNFALDDNNATYNMISFGGDEDPAAKISLDYSKYGKTENNIEFPKVPGIKVDLGSDVLEETKAFVEAQITNDLSNIAAIDRGADEKDGIFTVYFKDLQERVKEERD